MTIDLTLDVALCNAVIRLLPEGDTKKFFKRAFNKQNNADKRLRGDIDQRVSYNSLEDAAEAFRQKLIRNTTPSELLMTNILKNMGIDHEFQNIVYYNNEETGNKSFYITDFLIGKTIIEIDGGYHDDEFQIAKDTVRTKRLEQQGYKVVRFTNREVKAKETTLERLKEVL